MDKQALTTGKMPRETEQQYTAWLLYCEMGSLKKTLAAWSQLGQSEGEMRVEFANRLGKTPSEATIERWSKEYRWVERKDLKLTEDLVGIRKKSQEFTQRKLGIIGELMWEKFQGIRRQIKKGEVATVDEAKKLWEMFRTEMGESLGKHEVRINEDEQKPPTEEEIELGSAIDDAIEEFYGRKGKTKK